MLRSVVIQCPVLLSVEKNGSIAYDVGEVGTSGLRINILRIAPLIQVPHESPDICARTYLGIPPVQLAILVGTELVDPCRLFHGNSWYEMERGFEGPRGFLRIVGMEVTH